MAELLLLFLAGLIGMLLRYIIKGEFDIGQLYILLMFPLGILFILIIDRCVKKKEREQPNLGEENELFNGKNVLYFVSSVELLLLRK
ncbi:hypothetical protein J2S00_003629 [Caldalkalibacillus uzonensis]|uniref:Uncharacterized protein n=1 Tax=Caldalkalibacillus uzonensis TaxID=353224 RepID=A0ABU0CXE7_9BACI|nr:hypothetical protein [Caldalkalibacillus uzonensis]MDQ0340789.1 hypothetical protein [Caldalkalibacillus uzonensis]